MTETFPVIDLFAGPGGLGEGFSAFKPKASRHGFDVRLSIEMDESAHQTLLLRKFFRAFEEPPEDYFEYVSGRLSREDLFARHPRQRARAEKQAWRAELGRDHKATVTRKIAAALNGARAWALIGGPPCQAYSLVGRSRMQSKSNPEFEKDHRHFLYREYLRIVARHRPPIFLMENVKGLLSATHGGQRIFQRILADLHQPSRVFNIRGSSQLRYRLYPVAEAAQTSLISGDGLISHPRTLVVRAEDYGIPQGRHRVFVLGIREDLRVQPAVLNRAPLVSASTVLNDLPAIRSTLSKGDTLEVWRAAVDTVRDQAWFRASDSSLLHPVAVHARKALASIQRTALSSGAAWMPHSLRPAALAAWYRADCRGLSNHEARGHMASDLHRYLFAASFADALKRSPALKDFPKELLPAHRNAESAGGDADFADRFRVQLPDRPSSTITAHISKDGHYFIHFDAAQCRSLTVREAARLQTFPDNYHFEGGRTEQYHQVGNAVPPLLAHQIAAVVHDVLRSCPDD